MKFFHWIVVGYITYVGIGLFAAPLPVFADYQAAAVTCDTKSGVSQSTTFFNNHPFPDTIATGANVCKVVAAPNGPHSSPAQLDYTYGASQRVYYPLYGDHITAASIWLMGKTTSTGTGSFGYTDLTGTDQNFATGLTLTKQPLWVNWATSTGSVAAMAFWFDLGILPSDVYVDDFYVTTTENPLSRWGVPGPQGATGTQGIAGPQGATGTVIFVDSTSTNVTVNSYSTTTITSASSTFQYATTTITNSPTVTFPEVVTTTGSISTNDQGVYVFLLFLAVFIGGGTTWHLFKKRKTL